IISPKPIIPKRSSVNGSAANPTSASFPSGKRGVPIATFAAEILRSDCERLNSITRPLAMQFLRQRDPVADGHFAGQPANSGLTENSFAQHKNANHVYAYGR